MYLIRHGISTKHELVPWQSRVAQQSLLNLLVLNLIFKCRGGVNSIPECFANHKILPLRRDVISVRKSPWREFLMAAFRTITNSVTTVLRYIPLTYVHYVSNEYFAVSLVGILP